MYDIRQLQYLKEGEIAGMGTINPIVRFLRNIRTTSQNVHIDGNPMGGIDIAVDQQQGGGGTSSFRHSFQPTVNGTQLTIGAGLAFVGTWIATPSQPTEIAMTVIPSSTSQIDPSKLKYFFHSRSTISYDMESQTTTYVTTFEIGSSAQWPYYYRGNPEGTIMEMNVPFFELVFSDGIYVPVVHSLNSLDVQ